VDQGVEQAGRVCCHAADRVFWAALWVTNGDAWFSKTRGTVQPAAEGEKVFWVGNCSKLAVESSVEAWKWESRLKRVVGSIYGGPRVPGSLWCACSSMLELEDDTHRTSHRHQASASANFKM
jgi:hypothetical protein